MTSPTRIKNKGREPDPVLVVGSVAYDSIVTPHDKGERILGGSASYACLAASYFAAPRIVGVVGHDFRDRDRKKLAKRGIDLDGLLTDASGRTFFWRGRYHENYNRRDTEDLQLNVFEHFKPRLNEAHRASPFVMLGNIRPDLQLEVLNQLTAPRFVLADTIDIWIETQREKLGEVMRRADLVHQTHGRVQRDCRGPRATQTWLQDGDHQEGRTWRRAFPRRRSLRAAGVSGDGTTRPHGRW